MGVNSLPKTVTRQRRNCDLNPGPSVRESRTLTTRLPSLPAGRILVDSCVPAIDPAGASAQQQMRLAAVASY